MRRQAQSLVGREAIRTEPGRQLQCAGPGPSSDTLGRTEHQDQRGTRTCPACLRDSQSLIQSHTPAVGVAPFWAPERVVNTTDNPLPSGRSHWSPHPGGNWKRMPEGQATHHRQGNKPTS